MDFWEGAFLGPWWIQSDYQDRSHVGFHLLLGFIAGTSAILAPLREASAFAAAFAYRTLFADRSSFPLRFAFFRRALSVAAAAH